MPRKGVVSKIWLLTKAHRPGGRDGGIPHGGRERLLRRRAHRGCCTPNSSPPDSWGVPRRAPGPRLTPAAPTPAFKDTSLCPWQGRFTVHALSYRCIGGANCNQEKTCLRNTDPASPFSSISRNLETNNLFLALHLLLPPDLCRGAKCCQAPAAVTAVSASLSSSAVSTEQAVFLQRPLWSTGAWS